MKNIFPPYTIQPILLIFVNLGNLPALRSFSEEG
jgi:hypothetical protein